MNFDLFVYESDSEELESIHSRFKFGDKINNKAIALTKGVPAVICYSLINLSDKNFGFGQYEFDHLDAKCYLERMKMLSTRSIFDIKGDPQYKSKDWHLNQTQGKNIKEAVRKLVPKDKNFEFPEIFHFALYPPKMQKTPDRKSEIKNPRVHFIVGANGMIYPLFYDPYHEMNPIKTE